MAQTTLKTNPVALEELLKDCGSGKLQLPDFQRSWVWDEARIKGLLASVSLATWRTPRWEQSPRNQGMFRPHTLLCWHQFAALRVKLTRASSSERQED